MLTARASPPYGRPLLGSSGLLRSVVSDRPRALLDVQAPNPTAVPRTVEGPGCCSREVDPLQSRHIPSAARRQRAGTGSHEVSRPFDDITRASPHATGTSTPIAVPLSGFLSLSAVCQHTRASRPCLMPQPSLGFSLQSVAPRSDRAPLSGPACSLAVLRRSTCGAMLEASSSGFRRTRQACAWLASAPPGARTSFPAGSRPSSPTPWTPLTGTTTFPAPSSASKPSSPRESALEATGCPATASRCSPGLLPLQSLRPT